MALRDLFVTVGFNGGKAIGGLGEVDKAADKTKLNLVGVAKEFGKLGDSMVKAGKSMTAKVTMPIVGLGVAAVGTVAKFDDTMAKVKGITGATQSEFVQLRKKALQMGRDTKFSASEAAEAFTYMGMAGWNAKQSLAGIDGVMALAAASGEELAGVSDIVTDALSAFQMQAKDAIKFADLLASAATNSNTNVGMLGESFKYVAPLFGALGYSAEDAALGLGLMANAGVKSSRAGTALRAAITNMVNPTDSMATAMETLGFSITDTSGKMKPFKTIMDELRGKFGKLTEEQQAQYAATIFGKEAMTGMLAIINASDEDYAKLTRATREYAGAAKRMAAINEDTVGGSFRSLLSAAESLAIAFGDVIKGPIREFADKIRGITVKFTKLSPATKKIIAGVLGIAAAIGPVLFFGGKLLKGIEFALLAAPKIIAFAKGVKFAFLAVAGGAATLSEGLLFALGPKGLIIAAIIGLITAGITLYKNWDKIKPIIDKVGNAFTNVKDKTIKLKGSLIDLKDNAIGTIKEKFNDFKEILEKNQGAIRTTAAILGTIFGPALIKTGIQAAISGGKIAVNFIANIIKTGTQAAINAAKLSASFIASMVRAGTQAVIAGNKILISFVGSLIKTATQAVITGATITVNLVGALIRYAAQGWATVASIVATTGAWIAQKAIMAGTTIATHAMTAAQWLLNAAMNANPIGLVITLVAGLTLGLVALYQKSEKARNIMNGLWNSIKTGATIAINTAIRMINKLISKINSIEVPNWIPIIGGKSTSIGKIPKFATGTNFFPGGHAIVGEKGPELVTMPRGASVDTNTALRNITPENDARAYSVNETFAPQINITIDGSASSVSEQMLDVRKEVEKALYPLLEEYWAQMRIKRSSMA